MKTCLLAGKLVLILMLTSLILGDEIPRVWAQDKPGWAAEWERTVAAARKEGQLNVYITLGPHRLVEDFQEAYPRIKVIGVFGRSSGLVQRMMTERRAGKYIPDARVGIVGACDEHQEFAVVARRLAGEFAKPCDRVGDRFG